MCADKGLPGKYIFLITVSKVNALYLGELASATREAFGGRVTGE